MNDREGSSKVLVHIAAEHRDMRRRACRLLRTVRKPVDERMLAQLFEELALQIVELHDLLTRHFDEEKAGGYLEEAVARLPRLATDADVIERQHRGLLHEMSAVNGVLAKARLSREAWTEVAETVGDFALKLLACEAAEDLILLQGYNEDPALFDLDRTD